MILGGWRWFKMVDDGWGWQWWVKPEKQEEGCSKLSAWKVNLNFWLKIGKEGLHF